MAYSDSISQLENILENLQSLTNRMKNSSGIHQIDIDLLQQKTRDLYEQIMTLETVSFKPVEEETVTENEETSVEKDAFTESEPEQENIEPQLSEEQIIEEEEIALEEAKTESVNREAEPEPEPEIEPELEAEETVDEPVNHVELEEENIEEEAYEDVEIQNVEEEPVAVEAEIPEPKTTLDLFAGSGDESLGAALSHKATQPNLGEKLEHAPVGDLREAIGINDKFQFINELFNGDMDQYNKVLDELNSFASLQGALTYLSELSVQYDFQKTGMAFQRLKAMLNKKYA
jgi:hypothetical protein